MLYLLFSSFIGLNSLEVVTLLLNGITFNDEFLKRPPRAVWKEWNVVEVKYTLLGTVWGSENYSHFNSVVNVFHLFQRLSQYRTR